MYREAGPPVNDGEREVLRLLRDELGDEWFILANFEFPAGTRWYECDALAMSPDGWAYLIETKHWVGRIRGNDHEWLLAPILGGAPRSVQSPVHVTGMKAKKLATHLKAGIPGAAQVLVQPLVVVVSGDVPELTGKSEAQTVVIADMLERVRADPRSQQARQRPDADIPSAIYARLTESSRPISGSPELGPYKLLELLDANDSSELWDASLAAGGDLPFRVKRYFLDPLLTGEAARTQKAAVQRDLEALTLLSDADGVVPVVGHAQEVDNSYIVATRVPPGRVLASLMVDGDVDNDDAELLVQQIFTSLAAVHERGITHRNLRPSNLYVAMGRVLITDFDYARIGGRAGITSAVPSTAIDVGFAAPEVVRDLAAASPQSDVFSAAAISVALCRSVRGTSFESVLPAQTRATLENCLSIEPSNRPANAGEALAMITNRPVQRIGVGQLEVHDVIDHRFVVMQRADTSGGTAFVYRVYDRLVLAEFAAKFVRPELSGDVDVFDEFKRLRRVPDHPAIVRPAFPMISSTLTRGTQEHGFESAFLLTDWVQGVSLADLLTHGLPIARVLQIGAVVADALSAVEASGVVHRDVKPENVILRDEGTPVLIDFNISASSRNTLVSRVGTPAYLPPEVVDGDGVWTSAADIYALGVCLAELIAGSRLGRAAVQPWVDQWIGGDEIAEAKQTLLGMVQPEPTSRPNASTAASQLLSALEHFRTVRAVPVIADPPEYPELGPNHNPYVDQLIGLFSQSSRSNAGTRGLDDFRRWLYVETRIDRQLRPAVLREDIRLLVISGNAGDGKTAFIRMIEEELKARGADVVDKTGGNGARLQYEGQTIVTNWDGSQDEGDVSNDDVLKEFFRPFAGEEPTPPDQLVAVIAINEGRLLDFLATNRTEFGWLERALLAMLAGDDIAEPWLSVVNLNLRALTSSPPEGDSIVQQLLARIADQRLWSACHTCAIQQSCYANANAESLRDPVLGPRTAERVRQALDLVRLRRRLHITMRDLMSVLAFVVAGNRRCDDIVELYENAALTDILAGFTYNALFAAADVGLVDTQGAEQDRLLAELAPLDVAIRPLPEEDARLWLRGTDALPTLGQTNRAPDRDMLQELWTTARETGRESADWGGLRLAHASLRRKHYFEREDTEHVDMFPYEHLRSFADALSSPPSGAVEEIAEAISHSEGLRASDGTRLLAVRVVQDLDALDRSFITHAAAQFELIVIEPTTAARYVEAVPDLLRLRHRSTAGLALDIDVDLWEALMRMRSGYLPSREDLRGSWLSLQTFKEKVASMPSRQLLIQPHAGKMTRVEIDADGRIVAEAVR